MNKHIELVEKWLADKNSVSLEELSVNKEAAAADAAHTAAHYAAYAAYTAAVNAANAAYYVKQYKELTK